MFTQMHATLLILAVSVVFFVNGKIRSDLVAVLTVLTLMLTGILTPSEAMAGFSNSVVVMMVGLFIVGAAILRTGIAKMAGSKIIRLAGDSEFKLFILVMLVTAFIGAFVSNTGTVAMMMPIVVSICSNQGLSPRRYLMPLAFASSMGLFTLISTPPNLVIQEVIINNNMPALSFFSFAPVGFVCVSVGIVVLYFTSKLLVGTENAEKSKTNRSKTLQDLVEQYQISNQTYVITVSGGSEVTDKTLAQSMIATKYHININKVVRSRNTRFRKSVAEEMAGPQTVIMAGDTLYCQGSSENIEKFVKENNMHIKSHSKITTTTDLGIAEAIIMPESELAKRTIKEIRFREAYNVNILGIQRQGEYFTTDITQIKLQSGDGLLVHGTWNNLALLDNEEKDLVLVGQPLKEASKITLDYKAPIALGIMLIMITVMVLGIVPAVVAVVAAACAMVLTGCLKNMEQAYESINWASVVLIAAMMPMATAFDKTGITSLISETLINNFSGYSPYILLTGIYFATSLVTMFISNTTTAILFAPIAIKSAIGIGASPYPFLFAVAVGASMCFASPFSTPPNALVMSAGRYSFSDYIRVGLPLQLIMGAVMIFALPLIFPFQ